MGEKYQIAVVRLYFTTKLDFNMVYEVQVLHECNECNPMSILWGFVILAFQTVAKPLQFLSVIMYRSPISFM